MCFVSLAAALTHASLKLLLFNDTTDLPSKADKKSDDKNLFFATVSYFIIFFSSTALEAKHKVRTTGVTSEFI